MPPELPSEDILSLVPEREVFSPPVTTTGKCINMTNDALKFLRRVRPLRRLPVLLPV